MCENVVLVPFSQLDGEHKKGSFETDTFQGEIQIPERIPLDAPITQVTFVFDVDKTLTTSSMTGITEENMVQIIRAARLQQQRPEVKIRFILITGSVYKMFFHARLAPKLKDWNWKALQKRLLDKTKMSLEQAETLFSALRQEMEQAGEFTNEENRVFPSIGGSIERRIAHPLVERLKTEGLRDFLPHIEISTAIGEEGAMYNPGKQCFEYYRSSSVRFKDVAEEEAIIKALTISYLRALAPKIGKPTHTYQETIEQSVTFFGEQGLAHIFQHAIQQLGLVDVNILPFDHEILIAFNDEHGVDGVEVAEGAMHILKEKGMVVSAVNYIPKGGSNYAGISLVEKADVIEHRVAEDEILVQGGDSTTDSFLFDTRFKGWLNVFFGKRAHVAQWPHVIVALDEHRRDDVQARGSGLLMQHVLDVMERGGVWGEVKFLNNQVSPYEVFAHKLPNSVFCFSSPQGKIPDVMHIQKVLAQNL